MRFRQASRNWEGELTAVYRCNRNLTISSKTYVGIELIRVLIENGAKPILMIAFTNHALDHLLRSVLDAKITKKIVRLGSRCYDERVSAFSIEELERNSSRSRLAHHLRGAMQELKDIEKAMKELLDEIVGAKLKTGLMAPRLQLLYVNHWDSLIRPPRWFDVIFELQTSTDGEHWQAVIRHGKAEEIDMSLFGSWSRGVDLEFLEQSREVQSRRKIIDENQAFGPGRYTAISPDEVTEVEEFEGPVDSDSEREVYEEDLDPEFQWQTRIAAFNEAIGEQVDGNTALPSKETTRIDTKTTEPPAHIPKAPFSALDLNDAVGFFRYHGESGIPVVPTSDRDVKELLDSFDMWNMSLRERQKLTKHWEAQVREELYSTHQDRFKHLSERHASLRARQREEDEEVRIFISYPVIRSPYTIGSTR